MHVRVADVKTSICASVCMSKCRFAHARMRMCVHVRVCVVIPL